MAIVADSRWRTGCEISRLDLALAQRHELILLAADFSWCCLFSHETDSMLHEELYERPRSDI